MNNNSNIAAVERALDVLLLLYGEGKEMGVSEIANQLGYIKVRFIAHWLRCNLNTLFKKMK